jgi:C-terminal processing protease CtpA/Prc
MLVAASLCFGPMPFPGSATVASAASDLPAGHRYWTIMADRPNDGNSRGDGDHDDTNNDGYTSMTSFSKDEKIAANLALIDYAVGTVNTQYYDNSGGAWFNPRDFYLQWKNLQHAVAETNGANSSPVLSSSLSAAPLPPREALHLETREGTVRALKWLVGSLQDPYSKYLTREELVEEREGTHDGFLGTGAWVEAPFGDRFHSYDTPTVGIAAAQAGGAAAAPATASAGTGNGINGGGGTKWLSTTRVANLPVVTAIAPNSPAERAGLVVGDRIVAVGDRDFLGWTRAEVAKTLGSRYNAETYLGVADLTIAKPVYVVTMTAAAAMDDDAGAGSSTLPASVQFPPALSRDVVVGYRSTKVHLPTKATDVRFWSLPDTSTSSSSSSSFVTTAGGRGEAVAQYELLTPSSGSIFDHRHSDEGGRPGEDYRVGYIRLTRFSKASTAGFLQAVQALEGGGARSYIIDLRNNYGGVIQEAMLTASALLRDPHAVLCYTMNARGGFTPHEVGEYVVDPRYPGYLLSNEPKTATLHQMMKEHPSMFRRIPGGADGTSAIQAVGWDPPSSYASLHEQVVRRGIRRISDVRLDDPTQRPQQQSVQEGRTHRRDVVILINEGTASSAEFFTAALRDNGRTAAVIGTRSFGKGLIQHTFPMPDGGGLKLTIGEFLRPSLQHVTNVLDARFDSQTGEFVGGGIRPDVPCDSRQGIPGKPTADLCVALALDVLEEVADSPALPPGTGGTAHFFPGASSHMMVKQDPFHRQ